MSAFGGYILTGNVPISQDWLAYTKAALSRRSPDGVDAWQSNRAGMAFGHLRTTRESENETQPRVDAQTGHVLCFDGRIDNRDEVIAQLQAVAAISSSAPDSDVIWELYQHKGESLVDDIVGDFAIALWDPTNRRLFCARSLVGWRPFHWFQNGSSFYFASDAQILMANRAVPRNVNLEAMGEALAMRFASPTDTLWKGVHRLRPGWALSVTNGELKQWQWKQGPFPQINLNSDEAFEKRFRELFDQALIATTRADRKTGAHISGGLDSSSVVCRSLELHRSGKMSNMPLPIAAVFPNERHDESPWIEAVEKHTGLTVERTTDKPYNWDLAEQWVKETTHLPLRPNTAGTIIAVCQRLQGSGIRTLLTGEGGDDWLSGNTAHWPDLVKTAQFRQLVRESLNLGKGIDTLKAPARIAKHGLGPLLFPEHKQNLLYPHLRLGKLPPWIRPEWAKSIGLDTRTHAASEHMPKLEGFAQASRAFRFDVSRTYINFENILAFTAERNIELRHPFHDHRLVTFVMGLPGDQLLRSGEKKRILRASMRGTLPEKVRTRQSKAQFIAPIIRTIAQRMNERPIEQLTCVREGWTNAEYFRRSLAENLNWLNSSNQRYQPKTNLAALWMAISTDLWLENT